MGSPGGESSAAAAGTLGVNRNGCTLAFNREKPLLRDNIANEFR